jgi:hypothetical protein
MSFTKCNHDLKLLHSVDLYGNVYIEPLPRNVFRNMAVLLLRNLATSRLREMFVVPMPNYTRHNIVTGRCHSTDSWLPTLYPR